MASEVDDRRQTVEYLDAVRYTQWFNTLACAGGGGSGGRSPEGLPIGVQIAARPFEDEVALGVAAVVDPAFGFSPPPMACGTSLAPFWLCGVQILTFPEQIRCEVFGG